MLVVTITSNAARVAHQQRRHGIDDPLLIGDIRMAGRDGAHAFEEEPVGDAQHVGLVHGRHLAPRRVAQSERRLGDAGRAARA